MLWCPAENLVYPAQRINDYKWKIIAQENLVINPHGTKTIMLQMCVDMSIGELWYHCVKDLRRLNVACKMRQLLRVLVTLLYQNADNM
jgi:hypothetical protein